MIIYTSSWLFLQDVKLKGGVCQAYKMPLEYQIKSPIMHCEIVGVE